MGYTPREQPKTTEETPPSSENDSLHQRVDLIEDAARRAISSTGNPESFIRQTDSHIHYQEAVDEIPELDQAAQELREDMLALSLDSAESWLKEFPWYTVEKSNDDKGSHFIITSEQGHPRLLELNATETQRIQDMNNVETFLKHAIDEQKSLGRPPLFHLERQNDDQLFVHQPSHAITTRFDRIIAHKNKNPDTPQL